MLLEEPKYSLEDFNEIEFLSNITEHFVRNLRKL
jgi:hypothetical protein